MKAYEILKSFVDYKKHESKIEKHFNKFALILKECNQLQNAEFLKRLVLKQFQDTFEIMDLEEKTKTYSLNHLSVIYRKYLSVLLLIIPIIGFSQDINKPINTDKDLTSEISNHLTEPILNNGYLEMEAIDCSKLELVNKYLETTFKPEDVLKKGVEVFRNEPPYQSKVFLITIEGKQIERIFEFNEKLNKFRFKITKPKKR